MEPMQVTTEWAPHRRAVTDADFLRRVTAAYRGRVPVLDALWWVEHPSLPSPDGHPSPEARSRELQRVVFSRQDDGGHPLETEELAKLEHDLAEERRAIREAIMAAWADDGDGAPLWERTNEAVPTPATERPASADPQLLAMAPMWRRPALAATIVGALLIGVAAGASARPDPLPAPDPEVIYVDSATGEIVEYFGRPPIAALAIFDRPQRFGDRLAVAGVGESLPGLPSDTLQLDTTRFLGSVGVRKVYAARDAIARICLVAVAVGAEQISSTCLAEEDFPEKGMRLGFADTLDRSVGPTADDTTNPDLSEPSRAYFAVRWTVDGSLDSSFEALTSSAVG